MGAAGQGNVSLAATLHNCKNNRAEKRRRRRCCRWERGRVRGANEVVNINEEIFAQAQVAMFGFNIVINLLLMYLIKLPPSPSVANMLKISSTLERGPAGSY